MNPLGLILVIAALLAPLIWFVDLANRHDPGAIFSQYVGVTSLIAMSIAQILATRWRPLEAVFGGLDRGYVLHKWLAVYAILAAWVHDTIDADLDALGRATNLNDLGETLGEIALYGLLILIVLTLVTFIPYQLWRFTHKFIGGMFALAALHFVFTQKPFANTDPLGLYVNAFCLVGVLCYLYLLLGYARLPGPKRYTVTAVQRFGDITDLTLTPKKRGIRHKAGQFAFLRIDAPGLNETHPFTISDAPRTDGKLRFTIKSLGDYSYHMNRHLAEGVDAQVWGPHGRFLRPSGKPEAWIAGGIGITPFLAWARAMDGPQAAPVRLYYCVRSEAEAPFVDELKALADRIGNFDLVVVDSS